MFIFVIEGKTYAIKQEVKSVILNKKNTTHKDYIKKILSCITYPFITKSEYRDKPLQLINLIAKIERKLNNGK